MGVPEAFPVISWVNLGGQYCMNSGSDRCVAEEVCGDSDKKIRKMLRSQCQNAVQCCRGSVDRVPSYKYRKSVFSKLVDS